MFDQNFLLFMIVLLIISTQKSVRVVSIVIDRRDQTWGRRNIPWSPVTGLLFTAGVELKLSCVLEQPVVVEEEPKITSFTVPIKQVEKQTKSLIRTLDSLVVRSCKGSNCIRKFLLEVVDEYRMESKSRLKRDPFEVTLQDKLVVIR